jgi:hypothetical protein
MVDEFTEFFPLVDKVDFVGFKPGALHPLPTLTFKTLMCFCLSGQCALSLYNSDQSKGINR